jgi:hypothetical protein
MGRLGAAATMAGETETGLAKIRHFLRSLPDGRFECAGGAVKSIGNLAALSTAPWKTPTVETLRRCNYFPARLASMFAR